MMKYNSKELRTARDFFRESGIGMEKALKDSGVSVGKFSKEEYKKWCDYMVKTYRDYMGIKNTFDFMSEDIHNFYEACVILKTEIPDHIPKTIFNNGIILENGDFVICNKDTQLKEIENLEYLGILEKDTEHKIIIVSMGNPKYNFDILNIKYKGLLFTYWYLIEYGIIVPNTNNKQEYISKLVEKISNDS